MVKYNHGRNFKKVRPRRRKKR